MQYQNEAFWCNAFALIRKIISNVDYKGVRDLLKITLDKVHAIPASSNVSLLNQLNMIYQVSLFVLYFLYLLAVQLLSFDLIGV